MKWDDFQIFKIGALEVPNSCLPLGIEKDDQKKVIEIEPSMTILNNILSLTTTNELTEIIESNVKGFVCVVNVDTERQSA